MLDPSDHASSDASSVGSDMYFAESGAVRLRAAERARRESVATKKERKKEEKKTTTRNSDALWSKAVVQNQGHEGHGRGHGGTAKRKHCALGL